MSRFYIKHRTAVKPNQLFDVEAPREDRKGRKRKSRKLSTKRQKPPINCLTTRKGTGNNCKSPFRRITLQSWPASSERREGGKLRLERQNLRSRQTAACNTLIENTRGCEVMPARQPDARAKRSGRRPCPRPVCRPTKAFLRRKRVPHEGGRFQVGNRK